MSIEERLGLWSSALSRAGVDHLIMGGHAVRYYGITRNTVDFDLVAAFSSPADLTRTVLAAELPGPAVEHPVWRHRDFARFEIGKLPDGRVAGVLASQSPA